MDQRVADYHRATVDGEMECHFAGRRAFDRDQQLIPGATCWPAAEGDRIGGPEFANHWLGSENRGTELPGKRGRRPGMVQIGYQHGGNAPI